MKLKHPITRADYIHNADGSVTVTARSGSVGTFDRKGRWLSGELRIADAYMCMFVADGFSPRPDGGSAVLDAAMKTEGVTA